MDIRFEAGLKRPRDATESAKLVSQPMAAVRSHAHILLLPLELVLVFPLKQKG